MSKKGFTYTLQIDAEINDLIAKTNQVKKSMQSIMDAGKAPGAEKVFTSIEKAIERLQTKASQPIESVAAFQNLQKDAAAVGVSLGKLGTIIDNLGNMGTADKLDLLPPNLKKQIEDASSALAAFSKATAQAEQKTQDLVDAESQLATAQKELKKAEGRVQDKQALVTAQQQLVDAAHAEAEAIKAKIEALKKYQATAAAYEAAGGNKSAKGDSKANAGKGLEGLNLPGDRKAAVAAVPGLNPSDAQAVADAIARLNDEYRQASKTVTDTEATQRRYNSQLNDANNAAGVASGKVTALTGTVARLNAEFEKDKAKNVQAAYTQLRNEAGRLGVDLSNIPLDYTEQNFNELNAAMNQLVTNGVSQVDAGLNTIQSEMSETATSAQDLGDRMNIASAEVTKLDETVANTTAFTERIKQFVGLQGGIQLARSAMRNALTTIKELDKAMTEMAVVTDLDVGDYWSRLPEYTDRANALGVSIKDAYESATLYYQQGLKTNEVVAMSNETLKMARIAGLSAEDATNKMTAALRGFNMELNETSAQRVADVYSELAAITASDVNEISSAMTKTASIAASAGMEFETTAAFLSQIIETTRESAETAGTALKTVIARFQELKKDPADIGEVDGEVVDANKIETALRSVGVALRDTSGQFRDLDDVFLELSGKWDSLDTNTQRYIATVAAGSRQQSRFIAMMSDYSRTTELVTAANTSAGASQEQFEKTMESLESKLNELKNAWDSFTMGIMNSEVIKVGIDLLTGLLNILNMVSDWFGAFSGAAKIGMLVAALYLGDKALKVFTASLKSGSTIFGAFGKVGSTAIQKLQKGFIGLKKQIAKLTGKKINVDFKPATVATEQYNAALIKANEAEKMRKAATAGAQKDVVALATADKLAAEAEEEKTKAIYNYAAAQGLTTAQASASLALQAAGVSADIAEAAAIGGLTTAKALEYQASMIAQGASATEIATRMTQIATLYAEAGAEGANTAAKKTGIAAIWAKISAGVVHVASLIAETVAQWALNVAVYAGCPPMLALALIILILVAAVALVVVGIIALVGWFKKMAANSPEAKLEAAKTAAEVAGEAAEQASEAYKNLADSFDSLSDKYAALEDLTQGSREWRDAVKEINDEVLNLVEQYPELAGLVENEGGVLTLDINSAEAQAVLDDYEARAMRASSANIAAKMSVLNAQNDVDYSNLSGKTKKKAQKAIDSDSEDGMSKKERKRENTDQMAAALAQGLLTQREDGEWQATSGSDEAFEALGLTASEAVSLANALGDDVEALKAYGKEVQARTEQEKALYEALALNAVQMVDTAEMTEDEQKQISVAANADYAQLFEEQAKNSIDAMTSGMDSDEYAEYAKEKAKELYGTEDVEVDKDGNVTVGKGDDAKTVSSEEFEKQLAAAQGTEDAAAALQNLPKAIDSVSAKMGKAGKAFEKSFMADEGKAMTRGDIEALKSYSNAELENLYNSLSATEQQAFGSYENFQKHIQDSIELGSAAFDTASKTLTQMGAVVKYNEKMTGESAQGYADQLEYIMQGAGQAGVDQVNNALNSLAGSMDDEELNKFMGQLNAMDWKNMEDWENLPDLLKEVGLNVPDAELEKFIKVASDTAGAVKAIDLEALNEQMLNLQSLSSKIKSGEQGRNISSSDYEALIAADPDLAGKFQQTLDGEFVYLGGSMDELTAAISANTDALLAQATEQLQNKVDAAELMQDMAKSWSWSDGTKADITKWKSWEDDGSASNATGYLNSFISEANSSGMDLSQLGIAGLSNDTDVTKMTEEQINAMMDSLVGVFNDFETNSALLMEKTVNALSLSYQNRDATSNSMEATNLRNIVAKGGSLNEDQQVAMKASTNAITAQAVTAGVNGQDIGKYTDMVANMEAVQESYKRGEISLKQFKQQYAAFAKEAEAFEREVVNKTNLNKMNASLQSTMETVGELGEKFDKLKDEGTKMEVVAQMVEQFGIQVNESNYEAIGELATTMAAGGEAGYQAFEQLMVQAGAAYGLTLDQVSNMSMQTWNDSTRKMSSDMQAFADSMIASGAAMWQEMADGSKKFVWATQNNLMDATEAAGTALEAWENPYTWLYNYNEEINRLTREREKVERAYNRALEDSSSSASELLALSRQQLDTLEQEAAMQATAAARAQDEISAQFADNAEFAKYVQYDAGSNSITIDYAGLDAAGFNEKEGADFEKFLSAIEENRDVITDAEDALYDIEDQINEIKDRGKEETSELYNQIKEGLVMSRQQEIDELQAINDSVQEASATLVEQMQKQIEEARQARENEKTENDISDKETRLAYLMRDTSGGNAMEIAALQKEIADQKEGYTDSLVDQQLQSLQDANEQAAQQRQQQIDIAQAQLDAYANGSAIWQEVQNILLQSQLEAQASEEFSVAWMETEAAHYIALTEGINSLNPIEQQMVAESMAQNAQLSAVYSGVAALSTSEADTLNNAILTGALNTLNTTMTQGSAAEQAELLKSDARFAQLAQLTSTLSGGNSELLNALSSNGAIDKTMSLAKSSIDQVFSSLSASGTLSKNLGSLNTSLAAKTESTTKAVENSKKAIDDVKTATGTLGNSAIPKGADSIVAGGSTNTQKVVNAILKTNDSTTGGAGTGTSGTSGSSSNGYTGQSSGGGSVSTVQNAGSSSGGGGGELSTADQIKAAIKKTNAYSNTKGNNWNWKDMGNGKEEDGGITIGSTHFRLRTRGAKNDLAQYAKDVGVAYGAVFYYGGGNGFDKGYYLLDGDNGTRVGKLVENEKDWSTFDANIKKYKEGGLADYTGPAWLDGTKSKPEIVLNQTDSANFMQLRDILADILQGTSGLSGTGEKGKGGDNYFDIEINVESITDDYDVEQLADKIRDMIYEDSTYRNVNSISGLR